MRKNNKQEKGKKQKKANDLAWDLFSQSGSIAHYPDGRLEQGWDEGMEPLESSLSHMPGVDGA